MGEPLFSIDFTARMIAAQACAVGDLLVFDSADGIWRVSSGANRTTANARSQAVALTAYGGSMVGKVSYQASGTVAAEISGLDEVATMKLVRCSAIGRFERVDTYTVNDDIVGYAEPDGRVHLHLGIPWSLLIRSSNLSLPWYDPRDYGALLDGTTDDLPAFDAMYADMPTGGALAIVPGYAWLSDVWRVNKQITIWGLGGGVRGEPPPNGLEVAPGREAALALGPAGSADAAFTSALRHHVSHLTLRSRCMIHPTAYGTSGGTTVLGCLQQWAVGAVVRKGDVFVASSSASPTRCFRCTDTGLGLSASVFDATEPTWVTTMGGTTTHGGMTFVAEAVVSPTTHQTNHAYVVGDRVFALNDNRFVFECTSAGTSSASRPGELAGGDKTPTGIAVLASVTDGGVTWSATIMDGIYVNSAEGTIQCCEVQGFTTVGYRHQGGVGQDARYTTFADNFRNLSCYAQYCGAGWYAQGDDANGFTIDNPVGNYLGWFHPKPFTTLASELGLGGHVIHEHTQGGGTVSNLYCQVSTGRPVLKSSSSSRLALYGCSEETVTESHFLADVTGQTTIIGGLLPVTSDSLLVLKLDQQGQGRGITERDTHGAVPITVTLTGQDGVSAYALQATDSNDPFGLNDYRYRYGPIPTGSQTGHWAMSYGPQTNNTAYLLSTSKCGLSSPGAGWLTFPFGHLVGNPASGAVFRGSEDAYTRNYLRHGARKAGDEFVSGSSTRVLTSDGFKGIPWTVHTLPGIDTAQAYTPWAYPATMVEPTTNTDTPFGGEKVFRCTTEGIKGGSEPNWSTAVTPGDTVTDNTVTWTLVGFTPSYAIWDKNQNEFSSEAKPGRAFSDWGTVSTEDATPANVLEISVPAATYGDCVINVHVEMTVAFVDSGNTVGGNLSHKASFYRTGGTLTLGTDEDFSSAGQYTGPATGGFALAVLDNDTVKVPVTGIAATDINWTASAHIQIVKAPA